MGAPSERFFGADRSVCEFYPSGLMLAARITLPHFSASSLMRLPKSAGEPASAAAPKSASRAFILGSARAPDQARDDVGRAAGRKADDDAHRPRRIGLRPREARDGRQHGSAGGQM
jgi:hypothetical protein